MDQVIKPTVEPGCLMCLRALPGFSHTDEPGFAQSLGEGREALPTMRARLLLMWHFYLLRSNS